MSAFFIKKKKKTLVVFSYNWCSCHREACETALKEKHFLDESETEGFLDEPATSLLQQLETLRKVFREAAETDMPTEVSAWVHLSTVFEYFPIT